MCHCLCVHHVAEALTITGHLLSDCRAKPLETIGNHDYVVTSSGAFWNCLDKEIHCVYVVF